MARPAAAHRGCGTPSDNGRRLARLLDGIVEQTLPAVLSPRNPYEALFGAIA